MSVDVQKLERLASGGDPEGFGQIKRSVLLALIERLKKAERELGRLTALNADKPGEWRYVGDRRHQCGGRVLARTGVNARPNWFEHDTPIRCEGCGWPGQIFAEDGGVEFIWHTERGHE
ncbi:hypothetical protein MHM84_03495 [Halomonas sp. McH1-25]|uniref:hypothetical protein n=1 Tax=unclassified Halomonas TaxID=2609666 RepID=UPI001EF4CD56|nr:MULTISPECIES: hypothetical protein [unclassified Halomonas]MCG7598836.1 hypothetical protein [Halomonas sp. McH1-25]MCP1340799.1 hypothetical protein [Halomonas sp. FL8]MCP1362222.1 hypothetical protein [Halomonas sp. BBD45]MCP1364114.1 hypothetical protein [Halomonas sp. BBD48]